MIVAVPVTPKFQFSDSKAKLGGVDGSTIQRAAWSRYVQLCVNDRTSEGSYHISYENSGTAKQAIGILDLVTSKYIDLLSSIQGLSFVVVLSSDDFDTLKKKAKKSSLIFEVSINIIGPARVADQVADTLLHHKCYLQHPVFLSPGTKYINPQYFYAEDTKDDLRHFIGPSSMIEAETLFRQLRNGLEDVFGSLAEQEQGRDIIQVPLGNGVLRTVPKP